jgi:hypothetical protein
MLSSTRSQEQGHSPMEQQERSAMKQQDAVFAVGSRVYVTSDGPFWGRCGTIRTVRPIPVEFEDPWYFSLVKLEGTESDEPVWLEQDEVEAIPSFALS